MANSLDISTSKLKGVARERLLGNYGQIIAASIVVNVIYFFCMLAIMLITNFFIALITEIIIDLLFGVFKSGKSYMLMNLAYGQPVNVSDVFIGFKQNPDKAIMIQLIYTIAILILQIPQFMNAFGIIGAAELLIATLILLIPYIILSISLSQVFFLLQDYPDNTVRQLVRKSLSMMRNNYFKFIKLVLSFIPMMLIGFITFFVPLLWVNAYYDASRAMFYKELISSKDKAVNA